MTRLAGLDWSRPGWLALLVLPLILVVVARRVARPERLATGTLAVWRRVDARSTSRGARARRRVPLDVVALALSLVASIVALAGPARPRAEVERLRIVVDRSPSMYLLDAGQSRLERALALARPTIERFDPSAIEWSAPGVESDVAFGGRAPPTSWLTAPRVPRPELDPRALDVAQAVWITDRFPAPPPTRASVFASGGAAVPGPVGVDPPRGAREAAWIVWNGNDLSRSPEPIVTRRGHVWIDARAPAWIAGVVRDWAAARGLPIADTRDDAALAIVWSGREPAVDVAFGRAGWSGLGVARGAAPASDPDGPLVPWLAARGLALVTHGPGRIVTSLDEIGSLSGDPAAFAVAWSELCDAAWIEPPPAVPYLERRAAGAPLARVAFADLERHSRGSDRLTATLALVAAGLGLASAWLAGRRLRPSSGRGAGAIRYDGGEVRST